MKGMLTAARRQRVPEDDARVREACRIDDDERRSVTFRSMNAVDQFRLAVALEGHHLAPALFALLHQPGIDRGQRLRSIVLGLALPEQVQVGAVHHQDLRHGR